MTNKLNSQYHYYMICTRLVRVLVKSTEHIATPQYPNNNDHKK